MQHGCVFQLPGSNCELTIQVVDLLNTDGLKIIHRPAKYTPGRTIVNSHALVGQFEKLCDENDIALAELIDRWKSALKPLLSQKQSPGMLCPVYIGNEVFCLSAFCHMDDPYSVGQLSVGDYFDYWNGLWTHLICIPVERDVVNVALPGVRFVTVGTSLFSFEQKMAVAVYTFFRHMSRHRVCRHLRICITQKDLDSIDLSNWENSLLPFLYNWAHLPIVWHADKTADTLSLLSSSPVRKTMPMEIAHIVLDDFSELISHASKANGSVVVQYDGSKRTEVMADINVEGLKDFVRCISSDTLIMKYLAQTRGESYDRNRLFQLIGVVIESSNLFGELNRKSVLQLCFTQNGMLLPRWNRLATSYENIVTYVGQRLSDLKKKYSATYQRIKEAIPNDFRRK